MSTEKKAPDGVNTLTIDDEGGVTSTLMHVPNKMSTEKDREAVEYSIRVGEDRSHRLKQYEGYKQDLIEFAETDFNCGIQHARQGERERLKKAMIKAYLKGVNDCPDDKYFGHLPCEKDAEELFDDYEIDEFLEQESKI